MTQTKALQWLRENYPLRYAKLDLLYSKNFFDFAEVSIVVALDLLEISRYSLRHEQAYPLGTSRAGSIETLLNRLEREISAIPPSQLLNLIGQALMWQKHKGWIPENATSYDLLKSQMKRLPSHETTGIPSVLFKTVKYSNETLVECAQFSPDGQFIVVGTVDGFIEIWDLDGKLKETTLSNQEIITMSMEASVTCLAFNNLGTMVVSGSGLGTISVWNILTGQCIRSFNDILSKDTQSVSITSVCFFKEDSQILFASLDGTIR